MISEILKKKSYYLPKHAHEGGATKETHFATYQGDKYILRICNDRKSKDNCELAFKKFQHKGFLPNLTERRGKYFLIEFLEGRDLHEEKDTSKEIFIQIGRILAEVNKVQAKFNYKKSLKKYLLYLDDKEVLSKDYLEKLKSVLKNLKDVKLKNCLDISDLTADNCHLHNGKVYLTDIGAIKPKFAGFGITKCFIQWAKTERQRKYLEHGYNSVSSMKFYSGNYKRMAQLFFIIQVLYYKNLQGKNYSSYLGRLTSLLDKKFI